MIKSLSLSGFKSIRELGEFPLGPLTVLIGPNRSGKTNLIDFFAWLSEAGRQELSIGLNHWGGLDAILWAGGAEALVFSLAFEPTGPFTQERNIYSASITKRGRGHVVALEALLRDPMPRHDSPFNILQARDGQVTLYNFLTQKREEMSISEAELSVVQVRDPKAYPTPDKIRRYLTSIVCHRPFATHDQAPIRQAQLVQSGTPEQPATRLLPGGDNLSNVYYELNNNPRWQETWEEMEDILRNAFPGFKRLRFPADAAHGRIILAWQDEVFPKRSFPASMLSDGTLRFLCLLAVLYDPEPPSLVCIDEPEVGLHPELVKLVADMLQEAAERTQVVVATHSPQLIAYLKPEHVVVVEADDQGSSSYKRLDPAQLEAWLKDFTLGQLWLQGELGAKP